MKKILIYTDKGANDFCIASLLSALKIEKIDQKYHIVLVKKDLFQRTDWKKDTHLVIFPGGRDIPYHNALKGTGNDNIRDFVEKGGSFLGICAGGYYGSANIEFEQNGPLEIIAERELKFFPGIARGPAYGLRKFNYKSKKGAQIAKLNFVPPFISFQTTAYYNGGCAFLGAEKYNNVSILARYADIEEQPAAIVKCNVGNGRAVLSGVHPEYSVYHDCMGRQVKGSLFLALKKIIEKERRELFLRILNELINLPEGGVE